MQRKRSESKEVKCFCSPTKKQLVALAVCSDDLAAVSALPTNWTPQKCGLTLKKYLEERGKKYDEVLNNLIKEAQAVNNDIDAKVQEIAEILLSEIQKNQNEIDCLPVKLQVNSPLSVENYNQNIKQVTELGKERIQNLTKFKQDCLALERLRANGLKKVLKYQFQDLIAVGKKPPKDLLHDFDERIYDLNQQLLSNSRAYIELEAQLRLQLDKSLIRAKSILNQFSFSSPKLFRVASSPVWSINSQFSHKISYTGDRKAPTRSKDIVSSDTKDYAILKEIITKLVKTYIAVWHKVLSELANRLDNLYQNVTFNKLYSQEITDLFDLDKLFELNLADDIKCDELSNENIVRSVNVDIVNIRNNLLCLAKNFTFVHSSLVDACQLCNNYMNRLSLGQKIVMAGLDDTQTTHDSSELSNEVNFNIALEQMCNASDYDKLQQYYDFIINYLSKITETYNQHKDAEKVKLEDLINVSSIMSHVVLSEIDCFQINHPKISIPPFENQNTPTSPKKERDILELRMPLLEAVLERDLQMQEICEYENSFFESLGTSFNVLIDYINHETRKWVDDKYQLINLRYFLKLISHNIRTERIKAAYDTRLSELQIHESRLNSHLDALYNIIDRLPLEASEYLGIDAPELYPFCKWINNIKLDVDKLLVQEPVDPEFKRLKMSSYAYRLVKHRQLLEESLISVMDRHKRDLEIEIQRARIANVNCLSQIKLYFEGGRYASSEAVKSCTALVKAGDALELAFNRTLDVLNHRRLYLLGLADQQILPLQRIVEENLKHGAKNVFDKKILPVNKKK